MTLIVLGLDAADYRLVKQWDCDGLLLKNHRQFKTESHSLDVPATIEVWPTVATGASPNEHGVLLNPSERDSRSIPYKLATKLVQNLPQNIRENIISMKQSKVGQENPTTNLDHLFSKGIVTNWPGITSCRDWTKEGDWFSAVYNNEMSEQEFIKRHQIHLGKQIGWAAGAAKANSPVAGIHIHYLDHMGHLFAKEPDKLREAYEIVDSFIQWLRIRVDRLLIISDHGMQTTQTEDGDPGVHSWHAMASTTLDEEPPESVRGVRDWVESTITEKQLEDSESSIDAPTEHLKDLGYVE